MINIRGYKTEFHMRSMQESRLKNETNFEHDMKKRHIAKFRVNMTWFSAEYDFKRCHMDNKYQFIIIQ